MTQAWILAAGDQTRWGLPFPKQLVPIGDELLILRTVRQLGERGIPATIVTHDPRIIRAVDGQAHILNVESQRHRWTVETAWYALLTTAGRQVVLLGDVVFTDEAMRAIVQSRDAMRVFMRTSLEDRATGFYREIFGFTFNDQARTYVLDALEKALWHAMGNNGPGKLHEFYCALCGFPFSTDGDYPLDDHSIHLGIDDYTDDIDAPEDYEAFVAAVVQPGFIDTRHKCKAKT